MGNKQQAQQAATHRTCEACNKCMTIFKWHFNFYFVYFLLPHQNRSSLELLTCGRWRFWISFAASAHLAYLWIVVGSSVSGGGYVFRKWEIVSHSVTIGLAHGIPNAWITHKCNGNDGFLSQVNNSFGTCKWWWCERQKLRLIYIKLNEEKNYVPKVFKRWTWHIWRTVPCPVQCQLYTRGLVHWTMPRSRALRKLDRKIYTMNIRTLYM